MNEDDEQNENDRSYESMKSDEKDPLHYELDSDNEPPTDEVGDRITVVKRGGAIKEILETGEGLGKPGRPYIVKVIYKAYFSDKEVFDSSNGEIVSLTLGDEKIPYGLWRGIEHMRRGEKAEIMVKPKAGFNRAENAHTIQYPTGWDTEEKRKILKKRRIYYEVKLFDWIVRHDLDGDGMILKTMTQRGVGYDRPFDFDELTLNLKVY